MATFVGLDVSLKETSVCVLGQDGTRVFEGKVESAPSAIANVIQKRALDVTRIGLERDFCHYGWLNCDLASDLDY